MIAASVAHFAIGTSVGFAAFSGVIIAAEGSVETTSAVVGAIGTGGILAWYLWFNTAKALPARDRENREAFAKMAAENRESNERMAKENREVTERISSQFLTTLAEERIEERRIRREEMAELLKRIEESAQCRYNIDHNPGGSLR